MLRIQKLWWISKSVITFQNSHKVNFRPLRKRTFSCFCKDWKMTKIIKAQYPCLQWCIFMNERATESENEGILIFVRFVYVEFIFCLNSRVTLWN